MLASQERIAGRSDCRRRFAVGFSLLCVGILLIIALPQYTSSERELLSGRSASLIMGIGVLAIGLMFLLLPSVAKSKITLFVIGGALLGFSVLCLMWDFEYSLAHHHESSKVMLFLMASSYFGGWVLIGIGKDQKPRSVFRFLLKVTAITFLALFVIPRFF